MRKFLVLGLAILMFGSLVAAQSSDTGIKALEPEVDTGKEYSEVVLRANVSGIENDTKVEFYVNGDLEAVLLGNREIELPLSLRSNRTHHWYARALNEDISETTGVQELELSSKDKTAVPSGLEREELQKRLNSKGIFDKVAEAVSSFGQNFLREENREPESPGNSSKNRASENTSKDNEKPERDNESNVSASRPEDVEKTPERNRSGKEVEPVENTTGKVSKQDFEGQDDPHPEEERDDATETNTEDSKNSEEEDYEGGLNYEDTEQDVGGNNSEDGKEGENKTESFENTTETSTENITHVENTTETSTENITQDESRDNNTTNTSSETDDNVTEESEKENTTQKNGRN